MKPENEMFFVEIVAGCVWLTKEGKTTGTYADRGLWDTQQEASDALAASMKD